MLTPQPRSARPGTRTCLHSGQTVCSQQYRRPTATFPLVSAPNPSAPFELGAPVTLTTRHRQSDCLPKRCSIRALSPTDRGANSEEYSGRIVGIRKGKSTTNSKRFRLSDHTYTLRDNPNNYSGTLCGHRSLQPPAFKKRGQIRSLALRKTATCCVRARRTLALGRCNLLSRRWLGTADRPCHTPGRPTDRGVPQRFRGYCSGAGNPPSCAQFRRPRLPDRPGVTCRPGKHTVCDYLSAQSMKALTLPKMPCASPIPDYSPPRQKEAIPLVKNTILWAEIRDNLSRRYNAKTFRNVRALLDLVSW